MLIFTVVILSGLLSRPTVADIFWGETNEWDILSPSSKTCPVCESISDPDDKNSITTKYYKEMVAHLFNRNTLKVNPKTDYLERTITLTLTRAQLKIIESSSDIQAYNSVVVSILTNAKDPLESKNESPKSTFMPTPLTLQYICELLYYIVSKVCMFVLYIFSYSSEVTFAITMSGVIMAIWLIHKSYNKNVIIVIVATLVLFGYTCTYIECNKKLKATNFIDFVKATEPENPNFLSKYFGKFFEPSERDKKINKIMESTKLRLPFCRPDEVAFMYFNEIFFTQLQVIVEKIIESMEKIRNTVPFPYNYMGMIGLPFLFISILPLFFQNILNPSVWLNIGRDSSTRHNQPEESTNRDRVSGENLRILLDVLKTRSAIEEKPKNSAVEDVKDLPQAIEFKLNDSTNDTEKSEDDINNFLEDEKSKKE